MKLNKILIIIFLASIFNAYSSEIAESDRIIAYFFIEDFFVPEENEERAIIHLFGRELGKTIYQELKNQKLKDETISTIKKLGKLNSFVKILSDIDADLDGDLKESISSIELLKSKKRNFKLISLFDQIADMRMFKLYLKNIIVKLSSLQIS